MRAARAVAGLAVGVGLSIAGAASAQAWTWASSTSPIIMSGGGGYGNAVGTSYNTFRLESWLKDTVLDGQRVYVSGYATRSGDAFGFDSGLRTDGGSSYARMADRNFTTPSLGTASYYYVIQLCKYKTGIDPCSETTKSHTGL